LGIGFAEKVYENALALEMRKRGLTVAQQRGIVVCCDEVIVREYCADFMVNDQILIELKVVKQIGDEHLAQCMNYLRASGKCLCLLINFGRPRTEISRVVWNI
jgi:GxxExxY protein